MNPTANAESAASKRARPLPPVFTHRTAERTWTGPLGASQATPRGALAQVWARPLQVLQVLTRSDFRSRYRAQALGVVWSLLNPLVMMGIMSIIFTQVFRSTTRHFPVFLLIGLILWQWVQNSVSAATQVFVHNADVIKRTVFARWLLPVSSVLSYGINFCIESLALLLFVPFFPDAFRLSPALLLIPLLLLALVLALIGVALATSVLNVIYRDVAYLVNTALLLLYWLTPVIYPIQVVPEPFRSVLRWNPFGAIITALRGALMEGKVPDALGALTIVVPVALLLLGGALIFRHYERMVLDHV